MFKKNFLFLNIVIFGSVYAAKTSHKEIVSFINDDKQFVCNGENVKWFLPNGTQIIESDKYQINNTSNDASILTIKQINSNDIGTYTCSSNEVKHEFELKLYYPLTIPHFRREHLIKENENVVLGCRTTSVPKVKKITWYFEEQELIPNKDYKPHNDGILLENVKADRAGKYTCVAVQELDSFKNIQERHHNLIVEYAPQQNDEQKEITAEISQMITLDCEAKSEPNPSFSWLASGYETFSNIKTHNHKSTLKVKINSKEDFKTYTCLASNEYGTSNQVFVIREKTEEEKEANSVSKATGIVTFFLITLALIVNTFL
ncbi:hypothetical protein PVAND_005282 [Polypedilum vanderplanki]|uniref:Ig-like domain-containing protein n=1 Tax=Polypedilum vanderplanki TaxID=319348 RepID=A0A9J6C0J9_POLVA|nr:hypothetical protein PVAND_005282 [Polypedilum vanderplanki]